MFGEIAQEAFIGLSVWGKFQVFVLILFGIFIKGRHCDLIVILCLRLQTLLPLSATKDFGDNRSSTIHFRRTQ